MAMTQIQSKEEDKQLFKQECFYCSRRNKHVRSCRIYVHRVDMGQSYMNYMEHKIFYPGGEKIIKEENPVSRVMYYWGLDE